MRISIKAKSLILLIALFLTLSITIGVFSIRQLNDIGEKLVGEQALSIVKTFSYQINGDEFESLAKSKDSNSEYFTKMNQTMHKVKEDTGCTYLYTMAKNTENEYYYVICDDSETKPGDTEDVTDYDNVFKAAMMKGSSGYTGVEADPDYGAMLSAVVPIKNSSGNIVGILACDYLATSISAKTHYVSSCIFGLSVLMLLVSCIFTFIAMRFLFKRLNSIIQITTRVSDGDLTTELHDKRKDEFGLLASNFNTMVHKLNQLIREIKQMSEVIDENAANLSAASEEVFSSTDAAGESIGIINEGISEQAKELEQINGSIREFGDNISGVSEKIMDIESHAGIISEKSEEGSRAIGKLASSAQKVNETFTDVKDKITNLEESIKKINEMTELISNISSQTSLLALNASIEAARAGEAGKGFSVVAEQIQKLSEITRNSSNEIADNIKAVSEKTTGIMDHFRYLDENISEQMEISDESMKVFNDIISKVEEIIPEIEHITHQVSTLNKEKEEVIHRIKTSSDISKEIENSSSEIYSSSQEIHATSEEVAESAENLHKLTNNIISKIKLFQCK